jgi:hypothetical protein
MIEIFKDQDDAYAQWLAAHPDHFVLNVEKGTKYHRMHRASCGSLDPENANNKRLGSLTGGGNIKVGSYSVAALVDWLAVNKPGVQYKACGYRSCVAHIEWGTLNDDASAQEAAKQALEESEVQKIRHSNLPETEKAQLINARLGQGLFREKVSRLTRGCPLTGVSDRNFLIASHIKPWKSSDNDERLNGDNGLMLSPHVDKLFDRGWISFSDDGGLLVSSTTVASTLALWGLDKERCREPFRPGQKAFLAYHRENVFRKAAL